MKNDQFSELKKKLIEQGASKELYAVPNFHMKSRKAYAWFYTNTVLFLYCIVFDAQWCNNTLLQTMLQMSCTDKYKVPVQITSTYHISTESQKYSKGIETECTISFSSFYRWHIGVPIHIQFGL